MALLDEDDAGDLTATLLRDLTVAEVAQQLVRAPSTVRDWLLSGDLRGYKFNREWRVTESALRDYINRPSETDNAPDEVDIGAWRNVRRG